MKSSHSHISSPPVRQVGLGATTRVHTIRIAQPSDAAAYSIRVGNAAGSVDSNPADLVVCTARLLVSPDFSTNGVFSMTIQPEAGRPCQVENTTNLTEQSWATVAVLPNITGHVQFSETNSPTGEARFYRVRPVTRCRHTRTVFHNTTSVPTPSSVKISISKECGMRPSTNDTLSTPALMAATALSTLGIIPLSTTPVRRSSGTSPMRR